MVDHSLDTFVESRGAGRDANACDPLEPLLLNVGGMFDVTSLAAEPTSRPGQLPGVVGVFSADRKNQFGLLAKSVKRGLPVLGGVTDGIEVNHFDFGALTSHLPDEGTHVIDGLGGLRDDPDFFIVGNAGNVPGVKNDPGVGKVPLQSPDLDVTFLADDDRLESLGDQAGQFGVSHSDEWAGRIGDAVAGLPPSVTVPLCCSVSGDDDFTGGSGGVFKIPGQGSLVGEPRFDDRIVCKLSQDGGGSGSQKGLGGFERLADPETHPVVTCDQNVVARGGDFLHFGPQGGPGVWKDDEEKEKFV